MTIETFLDLTQHFIPQFIGSFIFLLYLFSNHSLDEYFIKKFKASTYATIALIVADFGQAYFATLSEPSPFRIFFAASGYVLRVVIVYYFLMINFRHKTKKVRALLAIPIIITVIAAFSAFFTNYSFYYTPENRIIRGPIISVPFIVSIFYYIMLIWETIKSIRRGDATETSIVCLFFVLSTAATCAEIFLGFIGMVTSIGLLGNVYYYIFFLSDKYTHDTLTGAYTREKLYQDFFVPKKFYGLITLDVNDLKYINDHHGHIAGDEALKAVVNAVSDVLNFRSRIYRMGGDEFTIIISTEDENEVISLELSIRDSLSKTPYKVATGSVFSFKGESLESSTSRADTIMYANKKAMKESDVR